MGLLFERFVHRIGRGEALAERLELFLVRGPIGVLIDPGRRVLRPKPRDDERGDCRDSDQQDAEAESGFCRHRCTSAAASASIAREALKMLSNP